MSALSKEENQFCVCYVVQTELYLVSEMHFDELYISYTLGICFIKRVLKKLQVLKISSSSKLLHIVKPQIISTKTPYQEPSLLTN